MSWLGDMRIAQEEAYKLRKLAEDATDKEEIKRLLKEAERADIDAWNCYKAWKSEEGK